MKKVGVSLLYLSCYLSILTLWSVWAVVPAKMPGIGLAGYEFFLGWTKKYPGRFGVNLEVTLGLLCLVGVAILPAVWATMQLSGRLRTLRYVCAVTYGLCLVAVMLKLDWLIYLTGGKLIFSEPVEAIVIMWGAVLHTLPAISIIHQSS